MEPQSVKPQLSIKPFILDLRFLKPLGLIVDLRLLKALGLIVDLRFLKPLGLIVDLRFLKPLGLIVDLRFLKPLGLIVDLRFLKPLPSQKAFLLEIETKVVLKRNLRFRFSSTLHREGQTPKAGIV